MIGIGDYDGKSRNRRKVVTREGQIIFDGKKYSLEKATGYMVCCSGSRKRLHVAIWEKMNGCEVPPGHVIHHKDWVKSHNYIENLVCVTIQEHNLIHNPPAVPSEEEMKVIEKLMKEGLIEVDRRAKV